MPVKTTIYGKTKRLGAVNSKHVITEKLDGANIAFFKYEGGLHVAQRNTIFMPRELNDSLACASMYKGLFGWLQDYGPLLEEDLQPNACIHGEWIGMGCLGYGDEFKRFVQFAKSNIQRIDGVFSTKNVYYDHELFKWSYVSQAQPEFIESVPIIAEVDVTPDKFYLDHLYLNYTMDLERNCEGFIVNTNNTIVKYVRMKNGTLTEHKG